MVNYNDYRTQYYLLMIDKALFPSSFLSTFSAKSAMELEGSLLVVATSQKTLQREGINQVRLKFAFCHVSNACVYFLSL